MGPPLCLESAGSEEDTKKSHQNNPTFERLSLPCTSLSAQLAISCLPMKKGRYDLNLPYNGFISLGANFPKFPELDHKSGRFMLHGQFLKFGCGFSVV